MVGERGFDGMAMEAGRVSFIWGEQLATGGQDLSIGGHVTREYANAAKNCGILTRKYL
jgi:hypothetical protein